MEVRRRYEEHVVFRAEDGHRLRVGYDNRGDPYRQGISLDLDGPDNGLNFLFIDEREAKDLRDLLNRLYPPRK